MPCHEKLSELDALLLNDCLHLVILNEYRFWELGESRRAKLRDQSVIKAPRYVINAIMSIYLKYGQNFCELLPVFISNLTLTARSIELCTVAT